MKPHLPIRVLLVLSLLSLALPVAAQQTAQQVIESVHFDQRLNEQVPLDVRQQQRKMLFVFFLGLILQKIHRLFCLQKLA